MSATFLSGVLSAWTLGHAGLGLFFMLAYVLGRREPEYSVFALLCGAFSVLTGSVAYDLAISSSGTLEDRVFADQISHTGGVLASALNVHFAACFAFPRRSVRSLLALYGCAALMLCVMWGGLVWVPDSYHIVESRALGFEAANAIGRVTTLGAVYYLIAALEATLAVGFLAYAVRRRHREALFALLGAALVLLAVGNDFALALGIVENTITSVPHVFLVYAFGASGTLLWRYRVTTGELARTTLRLHRQTEELRHSYAELAQVQSELLTKKQLAAVGELAAAIAHEVRNPLAVIVNAVAGLRRAGIQEDARTMLLGIVEEEAGRLNRLVTDLLRFARPVSVKRAPVSLLELARRSSMNTADGYDVHVEAVEDPAIHTVYVDPNLFRLVFDNLVANACQAMRGGGTVDIRIGGADLHGGRAARIEIRDRGHGMEPQVRKRALDPFFTTRPSGTGLGLPIVQRIIEAHGGQLELQSNENEGTSVIIWVPVNAPVEEAEAPPSRTEQVA